MFLSTGIFQPYRISSRNISECAIENLSNCFLKRYKLRNNKIFNRIGFNYKTVISIFFIFSASNFLLSQENTEKNSSLRVFITPSAIFNVYPGLQGGLEYKINNDWSVFAEFGAVLPAKFKFNELDNFQSSGYRIKGSVRKKIYKTFFLELNYYHRRVENSINTEFFRYNRLFIQEMNYRVENVLNGLALTAGVEIKMGNKWLWDVGGGIGPGIQKRMYSDLPQDVEMVDRSFWWTSHNYRVTDIENEFFPLLVLNVRLKYMIF